MQTPEGYRQISGGQTRNEMISVRVFVPEGQEEHRIIHSGTAFLLASTSQNKLQQNTRSIQHYPTQSFYVTDILGAVHDSIEAEDSQYKIALGKLQYSIEGEWSFLSMGERQAALRRMGVEAESDVVAYADDRGMMLDMPAEDLERVKAHPIWDSIRTQPMVEQVFRPGAPFPHFRLKEVEALCGGTIHFITMLRQACAECGVAYTGHKEMVVYAFQQGLTANAPKILVEVIESGRKLNPVTAQEEQREREDQSYDMDYLDVPHSGLANPDGLTLRELWLDSQDSGAEYWDKASMAVQAFDALMRVNDVPRLSTPRRTRYIPHPHPQLLSNRDIGYGTQYPFRSLADVENARFLGNGYYLEMPETKGLTAEEALLKRLELRLFAHYLGTMKPLGDPVIKDRPVLVDRTVMLAELRDMTNAGKFKAFHGRLQDVFCSINGKAELEQALNRGWKEGAITDNPSALPRYDLDDWDSLAGLSGVERNLADMRVGLIGSASSPLQGPNADARRLALLLAMAGLSLNDGGGTRYIMQKFLLGHLEGWRENSQKVGHHYSYRTEEVSRKEGTIPEFLMSQDIRAQDMLVSPDGGYLRFLNKFHVFEKEYLGSRQHGVLGSSDMVCAFAGGTGTAYEYYAVMVHNLMVKMTGQGLFPGLNNDRVIPLVLVNSGINGADHPVGFFDALIGTMSEQEKELACVQVASTAGQAATLVFDRADQILPHPFVRPAPGL